MGKTLRRPPRSTATHFWPNRLPGKIPDISACVSRSCLTHNVAQLRRHLAATTRICAVIKADAYCHGAALVADHLAREPVDWFATATIEEAEEIVPVCAGKPVLCMRPLYQGNPAELLRLAQARGFHTTICSRAAVRYINATLPPSRRRLKVHVKVDSGMGRLGVAPSETAELLDDIRRCDALELAGIYTHFATADECDLEFTRAQLQTFQTVLAQTGLDEDPGVLKHACNSAAALRLPRAHLDMVRPGIALYGYLDAPVDNRVDLRPAMQLKARLVQVKTLRAGETCGYGRTFTAPTDMPIGIVPVGYADGLLRCLSNQAVLRVGLCDAPVIGRVSMDQTIIDLRQVAQPHEGLEVTIIDNRPGSPCNATALAQLARTIPYEIFTRIGPRVKRVLCD